MLVIIGLITFACSNLDAERLEVVKKELNEEAAEVTKTTNETIDLSKELLKAQEHIISLQLIDKDYDVSNHESEVEELREKISKLQEETENTSTRINELAKEKKELEEKLK